MAKTISDRLAEVILISRERNLKIYQSRKAGLTYQQLSDIFGLTKQRIQAIVARLDREKLNG